MAKGSGLRLEVKGMKEILQTIARLKGAGRRILRKAINEASKPILAAAKGGVASETGLLKKSLARKVKTYPSGTVVGIIGPRKGHKLAMTKGAMKGGKAQRRYKKALGRDPAKYAHLVERGAKPHAIGRGASQRKGRQAGRLHPGSRPQPFMEPALERNKSTSLGIIRQVATEELEKEARKAAAK